MLNFPGLTRNLRSHRALFSGPVPLPIADAEEIRQAQHHERAQSLRASVAESERKIAELKAVIEKQTEARLKAASEKEPAINKMLTM